MQVLLPNGLTPQLPAAFNRNMLPLFLVANLLTGLVNLSVDTLSVTDPGARLVVGGYAAVVCGLAASLEAWGIQVKFKKLQT